MKMTSSSASLSLTRLLLLLLSSAVVAAFDSTEIRMLDDDYLSSKRSAPLIRFGRRVTLDEHAGYPMMHLNKRASLADYDGGDIDEEALARTIRAQVGAPLIRFGKRAAASSPLIRFGRAPAAAAPLIRFGKRSAPAAPFVRFGRANIAAPAAPLIRFGKRSGAADAEKSDNEE